MLRPALCLTAAILAFYLAGSPALATLRPTTTDRVFGGLRTDVDAVLLAGRRSVRTLARINPRHLPGAMPGAGLIRDAGRTLRTAG